MVEYLYKFSPGELIALVAVAGGLVCACVTIIAIYLHSSHKAQIAAKLKADMLDRGMSADEIRTVLEAGSEIAPD
jgi:hypothetical protein